MRHVVPSLSAALALPLLVSAQSFVKPGITLDFQEEAKMSQAEFGNLGLYQPSGSRYIAQVQMTKGIGNGPGVYTCALTVYSLADKYTGANPGQPSGQYVLLGKWDQNKKVFTPTQDAVGMNNPTGGNFGLMLEPTLGREAVVDQADGVWFSQRPNPLGPFPAATRVTNWPSGSTYVDPALGKINGVLHLFWVDKTGSQQTIVARPLTVNANGTATMSGSTFTVAKPQGSATDIHSPTPVVGPDGNVYGLTLSHQLSTSDSDFAFKPSLDPAQPYILVHDNANWQNNGCVCGGAFFFANTGSAGGWYNAINYSEISWLIASAAAPGGQSQVFGAGRNLTLPSPLANVVMVAAQLASTPLQVPGIAGELGLDLGTLLVLGSVASTTADEIASFALPIPNDSNLKGLDLPISGLTATFGQNGALAFQNSTFLSVR